MLLSGFSAHRAGTALEAGYCGVWIMYPQEAGELIRSSVRHAGAAVSGFPALTAFIDARGSQPLQLLRDYRPDYSRSRSQTAPNSRGAETPSPADTTDPHTH
ncbi:hypothetical protein MHYP_G00235410 [Metynnis hypsauchen]